MGEITYKFEGVQYGSQKKKESQSKTVHKMGETVSIGYTSYAVWRAWWSSRFSGNEFLVKLIDENGAEYEMSRKAWAVKAGIDLLESLNLGVWKQGLIVFDVPRTPRYNLKVSGGYWSGTDALIEIVPE